MMENLLRKVIRRCLRFLSTFRCIEAEIHGFSVEETERYRNALHEIWMVRRDAAEGTKGTIYEVGADCDLQTIHMFDFYRSAMALKLRPIDPSRCNQCIDGVVQKFNDVLRDAILDVRSTT